MIPSVEAALANPWDTMRLVVGEPLHPGGTEATAALLDRAGVTSETTLLDVGCGSGDALALAEDRGATAIGLEMDPAGSGSDVLKGDFENLPAASGAMDVFLAECVLCLADDLDAALGEARRVVGNSGTLALSDLIVESELPDVPRQVAEPLCLTGKRNQGYLIDRITQAGFEVTTVDSHHDALLDMRDRANERMDYAGLLEAMGESGQALLAAIEALEAAVEREEITYCSVVASAN
jgi:SAM-dependent methyltransferase